MYEYRNEPLHPPHITKTQLAIRMRLGKLLYWLTDPADAALTDNDFVMAVVNRYLKHQEKPIIDPAE